MSPIAFAPKNLAKGKQLPNFWKYQLEFEQKNFLLAKNDLCLDYNRSLQDEEFLKNFQFYRKQRLIEYRLIIL